MRDSPAAPAADRGTEPVLPSNERESLPAPAPEAAQGPAAETELTGSQVAEVRSALSMPFRLRSLPLLILAAIAVVFALHATREVLLPVFVAILLQFLLGPAVRVLTRLRLPSIAAAAIVLFLVTAGVSTVIYLTWAPAAGWLAEMPSNLQRVEEKLRALRRPVEQVTEVSRSVDELTSLDGGEGLQILATPAEGLSTTIWRQTRGFFVHCLLAGALLFFLLAGQDSFLTKLVSILPRLQDKKTAVEIVRTIERDISRYLLTISSVNVVLGALVSLILWMLGMPNPLLWGLVAGLFNFVPYIGTTVAVGVVAVAGLLTLEPLGYALLPALVILLLSSVESFFITPALLGRRFSLSPVVLFVWLLAWSSMWGIPGALLAVPTLVIVHIVFDNIPALRPFAVFLKA